MVPSNGPVCDARLDAEDPVLRELSSQGLTVRAGLRGGYKRSTAWAARKTNASLALGRDNLHPDG